MNADPPPPAEWPEEIIDLYSPVRVIGKGGFASVWMAKKKKKSSSEDEDHVAVKVMRDDGYATREIAILSELTTKYSHPNIVRLLHNFKTGGSDSKVSNSLGGRCAVLSLARGPTLNFILSKYGGLGFVVAQSISQQLIGAVAFLHGHAVIHRDIQPCNIIISGSLINDDLWWSDELDIDGKALMMAKQCRVTLVDFGFARALSPNDIDIGLEKVLNENEKPTKTNMDHGKFDDETCINEAPADTRHSVESRGRSRTRVNLDSSVSHTRIRDLSALGTRNYAAPEILSGVRNFADVSIRSINDSVHKRKKKTLGACVSDYGMDADAFSVGTTIRHMVTGVSPSINVEDFIASKNHPLKKLARSLKKRVKKDHHKRVKKYRLSDDLPEDINDLIQILTHYSPSRRATVRSVTSHPWIQVSATISPSQNKGKEVEHGGPILYLQCAEGK
eukprot:CAMPEP_0172299316 /NCGR_PEP_ID=MMETSP1058-20130122/1672_1 /TAXON_ID=83371 /ORGANISM="Detonula confervacea, Strain CCMP 353" /LENGTH=446 /DNA_ID=CAMNT_0013008743 /DNA_START=197 /DNA_END=1537 /DNA_ORIENTATION=-